jgi:hypothetical protein
MLVIRDEQTVRKLEQIAEREQRPVEDVLKSLVDRYLNKIYNRARQYWESVGDTTKAALTDEELDEQFGAFDKEGIPRLKDELPSLEPPYRG